MNLYFECNMGAAGDMIAGALVDLTENKEETVRELNSLGLPDTVIEYSRKEQCKISGAHLDIIIKGEEEHPDDHHHHGRGLRGIGEIVESLNVDSKVKADVMGVYEIIAQAEAKAHNAEVHEIHFHELGMLDAVADITVTAYLISKMKVDRIIASPINVGSGTVRCAHGILPVPAPATANILEGIPYYKSDIETELCTPTGAALLKYFADEFTTEPRFDRVIKTGIGAGTKELSRANIIHVSEFEDSSVTELSCNIDDMTGEEAAFAAERIMAAGALDCFITPVIMKKGRPAYMLTALCKNGDSEKFAKLIFRHTTTLGIRKYTPSRYTLDREIDIESGVHIKRSEGFGEAKEKAEFEDLKALALKEDISIFEAKKRIEE